MAEVLLCHHAQGRTDGFEAFADALRRDGHTVHTPDLLDGRTFASIDEGMAYASEIGFPEEILERGARAADGLPDELVYAGFSLGLLPAQSSRRRAPAHAARCSSSTPAISITSPTRACPRTTPRRQHC